MRGRQSRPFDFAHGGVGCATQVTTGEINLSQTNQNARSDGRQRD